MSLFRLAWLRSPRSSLGAQGRMPHPSPLPRPVRLLVQWTYLPWTASALWSVFPCRHRIRFISSTAWCVIASGLVRGGMRIKRVCRTKGRPFHGVVTTRIVGRIAGMILLLPPPPDGNESGGSVNGSRGLVGSRGDRCPLRHSDVALELSGAVDSSVSVLVSRAKLPCLALESSLHSAL